MTAAAYITGNELALGRNHAAAPLASMTEFRGSDPCVVVELGWPDGACVRHIFEGDTAREDALGCLALLGWWPARRTSSGAGR